MKLDSGEKKNLKQTSIVRIVTDDFDHFFVREVCLPAEYAAVFRPKGVKRLWVRRERLLF
jgi:hypothetical protein